MVSTFLNENFIVWANDVRSPEGYQLSISMGATSYPFMAVVTKNTTGGITLLDRFVFSLYSVYFSNGGEGKRIDRLIDFVAGRVQLALKISYRVSLLYWKITVGC